MKSNLTRRKDGSYVLKHKTKKGKKGDCVECRQNEKNRPLGLLYRHVADDMVLVKNHIEQHLQDHTNHKSVTPRWCKKCNALIDYSVEVDINKTLGFYEKAN